MESSGTLSERPSLDQLLEALGHFKDWSNFMLVATIAALGWVAGYDFPKSSAHRPSRRAGHRR